MSQVLPTHQIVGVPGKAFIDAETHAIRSDLLENILLAASATTTTQSPPPPRLLLLLSTSTTATFTSTATTTITITTSTSTSTTSTATNTTSNICTCIALLLASTTTYYICYRGCCYRTIVPCLRLAHVHSRHAFFWNVAVHCRTRCFANEGCVRVLLWWDAACRRDLLAARSIVRRLLHLARIRSSSTSLGPNYPSSLSSWSASASFSCSSSDSCSLFFLIVSCGFAPPAALHTHWIWFMNGACTVLRQRERDG